MMKTRVIPLKTNIRGVELSEIEDIEGIFYVGF